MRHILHLRLGERHAVRHRLPQMTKRQRPPVDAAAVFLRDGLDAVGADIGVGRGEIPVEDDRCGHGEAPCFRSEEHTSELQSLMRISYAVFCLKKKKKTHSTTRSHNKRITK